MPKFNWKMSLFLLDLSHTYRENWNENRRFKSRPGRREWVRMCGRTQAGFQSFCTDSCDMTLKHHFENPYQRNHNWCWQTGGANRWSSCLGCYHCQTGFSKSNENRATKPTTGRCGSKECRKTQKQKISASGALILWQRHALNFLGSLRVIRDLSVW